MRLTAAPPDVILQAVAPPAKRRGFGPGVITGLTPQALLVLPAIVIAASASDGADPILYLFYPLVGYFVVIAAASIAVGLLCLAADRTRMFGKGLLLGACPGAGLLTLALLGIGVL